MLTPADIDHIAKQGESLATEFKGESRQALSDNDLVEAVVCLANGHGGLLLVGVEDDGRITGARPRHEAGATDARRIEALISNKTRPSLAVRAEVVEVTAGHVLAIDVPNPPVPIASSDGRYVRRALDVKGKPQCLPMFAYEMSAIGLTAGVADPTLATVSAATWDDLDPLEFERLRRIVRESAGRGDRALVELPDIEIAKSLGAVEANGTVRAIRLLGLLLFGREESLRRLVPSHEVAFQELSGTDVRVNDFMRLPLLRLVDDLGDRFAHRVRHVEVKFGMLRLDVPDYADESFREAVANALVHRDFGVLGAVHIQWQDEQLRIDSPGGFPEGVRLDNLLVTPPRPRNPFLADAFKRAGIVERTGRGIDKIFEGQLRYGRPPPQYDLSTQHTVTVVLRGGPANLAFVRLVHEAAHGGRPLSLNDLILLQDFEQERSMTGARAADLTQVGDAQARALLAGLAERGFVEPRGDGKARTWHLSAAIYRELGRPEAYVRTRGFEPMQHEQMVLQYVAAHGSIRRAQAAELCRISPKQAGHLLQRLTQQDKIKMVFSGRTSHYVPAGDTVERLSPRGRFRDISGRGKD